jgi:hypothetical protein
MPPVGLPTCSRHPWAPLSSHGCPQCYSTMRAYYDMANPHGTRRTYESGNRPDRVRAEPAPRIRLRVMPDRPCKSPGCTAPALRRSSTALCADHARARRAERVRQDVARQAATRKEQRHAAGLRRGILVAIDGIVASLSEHARRMGVHRMVVWRRWRKVG